MNQKEFYDYSKNVLKLSIKTPESIQYPNKIFLISLKRETYSESTINLNLVSFNYRFLIALIQYLKNDLIFRRSFFNFITGCLNEFLKKINSNLKINLNDLLSEKTLSLEVFFDFNIFAQFLEFADYNKIKILKSPRKFYQVQINAIDIFEKDEIIRTWFLFCLPT